MPQLAAKPGGADGESSAPIVVQLPTQSGERSQMLQVAGRKPGSSETLSLDAVDYDQKGNVVISGSAPKGFSARPTRAVGEP